MFEISDYTIVELLHEGTASRVFRAIRTSDAQPVVLKALKREMLGSQEAIRYRREFEVLRALNIAGVVELLGMETARGAPVLVLRDTGATSLATIHRQHRLGLFEVLDIAIRLVGILGELQRHGVVHKDLNPSNILYNPDTDALELIDFGCSLRLSTESPNADSPYSLEGTLPYMSPEQTGRTNRSVDYRTDFYALGVTLYELLSGRLPFAVQDSLELVHCHLARRPTPVCEVAPDVPVAVSNIVMKLMAKAPEERYQSARGCRYDLAECRRQVREKIALQPFPLGLMDVPIRFHIPEKLHGRTVESASVMAAFERVGAGAAELLLVAGYSGIGKSALVKKLYSPITQRRGYFVAGKFEQYRRAVPYSALAQAFGNLIEQVLAEPEDKLRVWREAVQDALESNGQVLIEVIPELHFLIGPQPPIHPLGPTESENRFNSVFQRFFEVFCSPEHPLVLFLDDLQWSDAASLRLVQSLLSTPNTSHLLLIGAYRDNEVSASHPLQMMLNELPTRVARTRIDLGPLAVAHLEQIIADTMGQDPAACTELAELVFAKTGGNPFFVNQFLRTLHHDGLLTFHEHGRNWRWDIAQVRTRDMTDNVVALMLERMHTLPAQTRRSLQLAACAGNTFDIETLAIICEYSAPVVAHALQPAIEMGLLAPHSEIAVGGGPEGRETLVFERYSFLHDRVQQAAYTLISDSEKAATHLRIGRLLQRQLTATERHKRVFELAGHFAKGTDILTDPDERIAAARLLLEAGTRARDAMAYETAQRFLKKARSLLPVSSWREHYELQRDLLLTNAQIEYRMGDFAAAEALAAEILGNARDLLDQLEVYEYRILFHIARNQMTEAIATALDVLPRLGISLPTEAESMASYERAMLAKLTLDEGAMAALEDAPALTDNVQAAAIRILIKATSASYVANPAIWKLIVLTTVDRCIRYGHSALAASAYSWYGALLCGAYHQVDLGYRFGALGVRLLERYDAPELEAKVLNMFYVFVSPWHRPVSESYAQLRRAVHSGVQNGDQEYAFYAAIHYTNYKLFAGEPLDDIHREQSGYRELIERYRMAFQLDIARIWEQTVMNLQGESDDPVRLVGDHLDEEVAIPRWKAENNFFLLLCAYCSKTVLSYIFADYTGALRAARTCADYAAGASGPLYISEHNLFYSLALLACAGDAPATDAAQMLAQVGDNQATRARWADHAPANFAPGYELVAAEEARVRGDALAATTGYERAVGAAREYARVPIEAIACERAARFHSALGHRQIADMYLADAYRAYRRWGARAKVTQMAARDPWLAHSAQRSGRATGTLTSSTTQASEFDLASVVKASQTISGQLVLDELLAAFMNIIIENAGAQRGYLLLTREQGPVPAAEGNVETGVYRSLLDAEPTASRVRFASSAVDYVTRCRKALVLRDIGQEERFARDPYVRAGDLRSLLCAPIEHNGALVGVIYLENNHIYDAFTPIRVEVVQMLASQAAISMENARLLHSLRRSRDEAERANRAKSLFLASVNHELRTPMNAIIGMLELLSRTDPNPEQHEYLDVSKTAANHLMDIIRDTLDLSQIEAERLELQPTRFSFDDFIDNTVRLVAVRMESKGLVFTRDIASDVPRNLIGDRGRLQQVIVNLLGNAIKFTEPGDDVSLHVRAETVAPTRCVLKFEVRDTGPGIAPAAQKSIFEPFHQAAPTGHKKHEGAGLGLAISARLVALMGGELAVDSELARGSCFSFAIGFDRWRPAQRARSESPALEPAPLRILLAEDNKVNQLVATRLLKLEGHSCVVANNGQEVLNTLESQSFDAVLMDVQMPVMNGREATRAIRRRERDTGEHLPVIAVTAYSTSDEMTACLDAGMDQVLSKPLRIGDLRTALQVHTGAQQPSPDSESAA